MKKSVIAAALSLIFTGVLMFTCSNSGYAASSYASSNWGSGSLFLQNDKVIYTGINNGVRVLYSVENGNKKIFYSGGNLTNYQLFEWEQKYYFLNMTWTGKTTLHSIDFNGENEKSEFTFPNDKPFEFMSMQNNVVYMTSLEFTKDKSGKDLILTGFYSFDLKSHKIIKLAAMNAYTCYVRGDWIYFTGQYSPSYAKQLGLKNDTKRGIYKIKKDGTGLKRVVETSNYGGDIYVYQNNIYYISEDGKTLDSHLFSVRLDGTDKKVIKKFVGSFILFKSKFYYVGTQDKNDKVLKVYSMNLDGSEGIKIMNVPNNSDCSAIAVNEKNLYLLTSSGLVTKSL